MSAEATDPAEPGGSAPPVAAAAAIPFTRLLAVGAITGGVAAAVTGLLDGLWTWGRLTQFLPGFGGKLRLLVYLAASHALVGLAAGTLVAAVGGFYLRVTRLGDLDRKSTRLNSSHIQKSRMPSSA